MRIRCSNLVVHCSGRGRRMRRPYEAIERVACSPPVIGVHSRSSAVVIPSLVSRHSSVVRHAWAESPPYMHASLCVSLRPPRLGFLSLCGFASPRETMLISGGISWGRPLLPVRPGVAASENLNLFLKNGTRSFIIYRTCAGSETARTGSGYASCGLHAGTGRTVTLKRQGLCWLRMPVVGCRWC